MRDYQIGLMLFFGVAVSLNAILMLSRIDVYGVIWTNIFVLGVYIVASGIMLAILNDTQKQIEEREKRFTEKTPTQPKLPDKQIYNDKGEPIRFDKNGNLI